MYTVLCLFPDHSRVKLILISISRFLSQSL